MLTSVPIKIETEPTDLATLEADCTKMDFEVAHFL